MQGQVLRVLGIVGLVGGLMLLFGANALFEAAQTPPVPASNAPIRYQLVRSLADLQAVPPGQPVVFAARIAEDTPATTFTISSSSGTEARELALYRVYTSYDDPASNLRLETPPFELVFDDGRLAVVNSNYEINFGYARWQTLEGPFVSGERPGALATVFGTLEQVAEGLAMRARGVTDRPPTDYSNVQRSPAFDTRSALASLVAMAGFGAIGLGVLFLGLAFLLPRMKRSG
ncbi:MAG: hypothetical protein AB4911_15825 [Oscillochloridaceae bacterium umkhey_bin13]